MIDEGQWNPYLRINKVEWKLARLKHTCDGISALPRSLLVWLKLNISRLCNRFFPYDSKQSCLEADIEPVSTAMTSDPSECCV